MGKKLKQLSDESKKVMRDQIDSFELQRINTEGDLDSFRFEQANVIRVLEIKIKKALKKIELLNSNTKALNFQIRNGVPDEDTKKMESEETEEKDTEETTEEETSEVKPETTEDSEDKEETESEDKTEE